MGGAQRQRMSFDERRQSIVVAACQAIGDLGVDAFRVADVADAAGISQPLVSRHFSSREELLVAAFDHADQVGVDALDARDARLVGTGAQRTLAWLLSQVDDLEPDLLMSRRMWHQVWGCRTLPTALNAVVRESQRAWLAKVHSLVVLATEDGSAAWDIDPGGAALHLISLADGIPPALTQGTLTVPQARELLRVATSTVLRTEVVSAPSTGGR